jgi:hypothetical protein
MDDVEQIEDNAASYRRGRNSAYQAVAIQLRNLVSKGRRGLLCQLFPDATLHEFVKKRLPEISATAVMAAEFIPPGFLQLGGKEGARLQLQFSGKLLGVEAWLIQPCLAPGITVGRLIQATADDEVAHTNREIDPVLAKANQFRFGGRSEGREMHALTIVAIGEYLARRSRQLMAELR